MGGGPTFPTPTGIHGICHAAKVLPRACAHVSGKEVKRIACKGLPTQQYSGFRSRLCLGQFAPDLGPASFSSFEKARSGSDWGGAKQWWNLTHRQEQGRRL